MLRMRVVRMASFVSPASSRTEGDVKGWSRRKEGEMKKRRRRIRKI